MWDMEEEKFPQFSVVGYCVTWKEFPMQIQNFSEQGEPNTSYFVSMLPGSILHLPLQVDVGREIFLSTVGVPIH